MPRRVAMRSGGPIERPYLLRHILLVLVLEELVDRQRQNAVRLPLRHRKVAAPVAERVGGGLQVDRDRIVDRGADAFLGEERLQLIAAVGLDDEDVERVEFLIAARRNENRRVREQA